MTGRSPGRQLSDAGLGCGSVIYSKPLHFPEPVSASNLGEKTCFAFFLGPLLESNYKTPATKTATDYVLNTLHASSQQVLAKYKVGTTTVLVDEETEAQRGCRICPVTPRRWQSDSNPGGSSWWYIQAVCETSQWGKKTESLIFIPLLRVFVFYHFNMPITLMPSLSLSTRSLVTSGEGP